MADASACCFSGAGGWAFFTAFLAEDDMAANPSAGGGAAAGRFVARPTRAGFGNSSNASGADGGLSALLPLTPLRASLCSFLLPSY